MGKLVIFMGPTGAGKSVQADRFKREQGYVHLSSGELLRQDGKLHELMATGQLVPSAEVNRVVAAAIVATPEATPIILDGFPRMLDEAAWLEAHLEEWHRELTAVVFFDIDQATSSERLRLRQRADDTPEALANKWAEYERETKPVLAEFERRGVMQTVDGRQSVDAVHAELLELLR